MPSETPPRQHYGLTLAALALGGLAFALLQSLVAPALPEIQQALDASPTSVTWVLTSYLLSASVATPVLGRLGDMFGKERLLLVALVALGTGTVLSAVASSLGLLIAGRVIQGLGGAVFPLAFGIIRDEFPRERVAGAIGMLSAILGVGGGAGIVLAGVIVDHLSYHWLFWFPLAAIVLAGLATWRYVPESPVKSPGKVNVLGAVLLSAGLVAVLVAVSEASRWGWTSARLLGLLGLGFALLGLWIAAELRAREPLVDIRVMRLRGVWTTNLVALLIGFGMFGSFVLVPQLVELPESTGFGFGASVTQAGLFLLPSTLAMLVIGPMAGWLDRRFGSRLPLLVGAVAAGLSFLILAVAHDERWHVYVASALLGVGIGLSFAAMANLIVAAVPQTQTGVATGMNTIMRTIGGALGSQVAASVIVAHLSPAGIPLERGFTTAFAISAGALVVALGAGLAIPTRRATARALGRSPVPAT